MARFNLRYAARVVELLAEWDGDAYAEPVPAGASCSRARSSAGRGPPRRCTCPTTRSSASIPRTTTSSSASRGTSTARRPTSTRCCCTTTRSSSTATRCSSRPTSCWRWCCAATSSRSSRSGATSTTTTRSRPATRRCRRACRRWPRPRSATTSWPCEYFREALFVDLADTHGNASDGVHVASAGGVWGTIVFGFAGLFDTGTALRFSPEPAVGVGGRHVPHAAPRLAACASTSTPTGARSPCSTASRVPIESLDGDGRTVERVARASRSASPPGRAHLRPTDAGRVARRRSAAPPALLGHETTTSARSLFVT